MRAYTGCLLVLISLASCLQPSSLLRRDFESNGPASCALHEEDTSDAPVGEAGPQVVEVAVASRIQLRGML